MSGSNKCRLCRNTCSNSFRLRDTNNSCSEVYYITVKFFHPSFLEVEKGAPNPIAVLCMKCWQHISSFNNYQQSILLLQANLVKDVNNVQKSCDIDIIDLGDDDDGDCIVNPAKKTDELEKVLENPSSSGFSSGKLIVTDCEIKFEADVEKVIDTNSRAVDTGSFIEKNEPTLQEDYSQTNNIRVENEAWDIESVGSMDNSDNYPMLETQSSGSTSDSSFSINQHCTKNKKSIASDAVIAKWKPNLECRLCPKTCPTFLALRKHFKSKHPKDEFYIQCCNNRLKYRFRVEEHAIIHLDPNAFKCSICGKCLTSRRRLRTHLQGIHSTIG